jgi:hypothetical protein
MAKRKKGIVSKKTSHSRKTKKRLAIKHKMLAAKKKRK